MEMLYRKVCKGQFQPIPGHYSKELGSFISKLLQVKARDRPGCSEILLMKEVGKWQEKLDQSIPSGKGDLIQTIRMPKQFTDLRGRFPKSKYETSDTA
jgi:NIMA (never in mitosis gene a)-related kinase